MAVITLNDQNFKEITIDSGKTVVEEIFTDTCAACAMLEPVFERASEEEPESENREVTYVLNANPERMRYHLPTCSSVDSIKPENLKYFYGTREEAEAEGYVPCGRCHPDKN